MKRIRTTLSSLVAGLLSTSLVWLPGNAGADVTASVTSPTFSIVNNSGLSVSEAQFYYLGVGTNQLNNKFLVLMKDGSWAPAGGPGTQWNKKGFKPGGKKNNTSGAGVVPCHKLVRTNVGGVMKYPTVTLPPNLVGARIYFFMVKPEQTAWFSTPSNNDFANKCNALPSRSAGQANGIFGNVFTAKGGAMPFSYFSKAGSGQYNGASPASILQSSLPLYTFSEVAGPNPKNSPPVADIDASQVDLISFPTNIIAQVDPSVVNAETSIPTSEGVGFSFSSRGEVNKGAVMSSFTAFTDDLPEGDKQDYLKLAVTAPSNGGEFLVNPGNYLSFVNPAGTVFSQHFLSLVNGYLWNFNLNNGMGWTGKIDLGGAFTVKGFPSVPQLTMTGRAVKLSSAAFPGYTGGDLSAIKFTATVNTAVANNQTFIAYVLSPVSYQSLCLAKVLKSCPANVTPAYQIFAGDGALSASGPVPFNMLKQLDPGAAKVWSKYDGVGGRKIYNMIVARLGLVISNAFNRGVAGGLPGGLCAAAKYQNNISYCWSDQANWYPNGPGTNLSDFQGQDITQNQFARWLHTSKITGTGGDASIPIMTQPTNTVTTKSGDVMGMAYGFGYDENPTPQLPGTIGQQTPAEYSSNVLSGAGSLPTKNCITIMPYGPGTLNPTPPASSCILHPL
jgi:hypothetical protein